MEKEIELDNISRQIERLKRLKLLLQDVPDATRSIDGALSEVRLQLQATLNIASSALSGILEHYQQLSLDAVFHSLPFEQFSEEHTIYVDIGGGFDHEHQPPPLHRSTILARAYLAKASTLNLSIPGETLFSACGVPQDLFDQMAGYLRQTADRLSRDCHSFLLDIQDGAAGALPTYQLVAKTWRLASQSSS